MSKLHTVGYSNDGGGVITITPQSFVKANSQLVSVNGSIGTSHAPCSTAPIHCSGNWVTSSGKSWMKINGVPVNVQGNSDTCGHSRSTGLNWFNVNG